jgi:hypothetical protein
MMNVIQQTEATDQSSHQHTLTVHRWDRKARQTSRHDHTNTENTLWLWRVETKYLIIWQTPHTYLHNTYNTACKDLTYKSLLSCLLQNDEEKTWPIILKLSAVLWEVVFTVLIQCTTLSISPNQSWQSVHLPTLVHEPCTTQYYV